MKAGGRFSRAARMPSWRSAVASVTACEPPTAPARDPRCIYQGDTIGVLKRTRNGVTVECDWLL